MPESVSAALILGKVPVFSGLAENELDFLAQRVVRRHYSAGIADRQNDFHTLSGLLAFRFCEAQKETKPAGGARW